MAYTYPVPQDPRDLGIFSLKTEPRKVFVEGDTIEFDIEVLKETLFFDVSQWIVTAELVSGARKLIGTFQTFKFADDSNRIRVTATYQLGNTTKGFYSTFSETGDYYVYVKLVQNLKVKTILPMAIHLKRSPHD